MAESLPSAKQAGPRYDPLAKPAPTAPVSTWVAPLAQAAAAFRDSYAEHLNHHCSRCTKAWADLNEALASIPPR